MNHISFVRGVRAVQVTTSNSVKIYANGGNLTLFLMDDGDIDMLTDALVNYRDSKAAQPEADHV